MQDIDMLLEQVIRLAVKEKGDVGGIAYVAGNLRRAANAVANEKEIDRSHVIQRAAVCAWPEEFHFSPEDNEIIFP